MKNNQTQINSEATNEIIRIDFRRVFSRLLSFWWLFVLFLLGGIAISHFYLRYATFEYSARAILLIKDAGNSGNISEQSLLLADQLSGGSKSMDNEIQLFKSLSLMEKVVERLKLNVAYYRLGNVKESELYLASPFLLDSFELKQANIFGLTYFLELKDYESFVLKKNQEQEAGQRFYFDVPFETEEGRFLISLNNEQAIIQGDYRISINTVEYSAKRYKSNLNIVRVGGQSTSSVLDLSIVDPVPEKARDILNTLIDVYNEEEINDENTVFRNTLNFIDNRVASLVFELDSVEGGIQRYKSANEIISTTAASSMDYTLGEIRTALSRISEYEVQQSLLESLENFLTGEQVGFDMIPANLVAETPILSSMVNQYNGLVMQYTQMANTASQKNPVRIAMESQLLNIRNLILETIQNLRKDIQIPIKEIERNIEKLRTSMTSIPGIEKKLIEKLRTQEVKEKLFLYLLQKREETALSEAVTTAKTRTIDRARASFSPVYPKRKMIRVAGVLLGLIVPLLIVLIISFFETTVDSEEVIKQLTHIPILGRIGYKKGKEQIIVKQGSRSAINEMFRLLRTNLNFINHSKKRQIIMVTSSISGEGKTFIALNLGITFALSNKKVILLGLDLRKPKLATYLGAKQNKGITNYLVGQNTVDEIIRTHQDIPNLSYISSGPPPPNPAEMILSDRMEELLTELANRYDYILIDTPPIGLVSDALLLRKFVDNILIVVRHKYTRKVMLKNLEILYAKKEIQNVSLVFNGVKNEKSYYGYGGYNYGYGYQSDYYEKDE